MSVITLKDQAVSDKLWQRVLDNLPPAKVLWVLIGLVGLMIPAMLLVLPMALVIGLAVVVIGVSIIIAQPYVGLLVFLGLLYLRPEENFPRLAGLRLTLMVSLVALFSWMINALLCREKFRFNLPAVYCFVGFLVVGVGSTLLSGLGLVTDTILDLSRLFILFMLIVHLVDRESRLKGSVLAVVLFTVFLGARTIWQFKHGMAITREDSGVVEAQALSTGIFSDPNDLSLAMAMAVPLALGVAMAPGKWFTRLWTLAATPVLVWTIFLTNSRGGMLALGAALFLIFGRRLGKWGIMLGVVAVLGIFALGPSRMSNMSSSEDSAQGRVVAWQAGLDMLKRQPVWGVGKNCFTHYHKLTAHNSLVLCLAETGLAGSACWLGLFYFIFRDGRLVARSLKKKSAEELLDADRTTRSRVIEESNSVALVPAHMTRPLYSQHWAPIEESEKKQTITGRSLAAPLQVSLMTFCVGGFFLSRTYTPPLYVYMSLAVAGVLLDARLCGLSLPKPRGKDWGWITALTLGSVVLFNVIVRLSLR